MTERSWCDNTKLPTVIEQLPDLRLPHCYHCTKYSIEKLLHVARTFNIVFQSVSLEWKVEEAASARGNLLAESAPDVLAATFYFHHSLCLTTDPPKKRGILGLAAEYLVWLAVAHLVADWLLQNDWMATNKTNLKHPAGWVHGAIHLLASWLFIPFIFALLVAATHVIIDTRKPMRWWFDFFGLKTEGEAGIQVAIWSDQVAHIFILSLVSLAVAKTT